MAIFGSLCGLFRKPEGRERLGRNGMRDNRVGDEHECEDQEGSGGANSEPMRDKNGSSTERKEKRCTT